MIELHLNRELSREPVREPIREQVSPPGFSEPAEAAGPASQDGAAPQPDLPRIAARLAIGLGSRWDLRQPLAIGGTSTIFKLRHRLHGGCFVAKVLHPWLAEQPELRQRFRREAAHLALLSGHPNTVPVLDLDEFDGLLYMLMPYIEGEDLDRLLKRVGALGRAESLMMAAQVASALRFAAARGVLHGDLSPGNIRLDIVGSYRLLDFGLSRRLGALDRPRWTGATPSYASPEQLHPDQLHPDQLHPEQLHPEQLHPEQLHPEQLHPEQLHPDQSHPGQLHADQLRPGQPRPDQLPGVRPDIRSDLFALGAILFEALAGRPLYAAANLTELEQKRKTPWKMPDTMDQDTAALLHRLLANRREDRLASPALLLEELARLGCTLPEQRERPAILREEAAGTQRARLTAVEEAQ